MVFIILSNFLVIFLFIYPIIECFQKVFMCCLSIYIIVVYHITIISNTFNKNAHYIEFRIV